MVFRILIAAILCYLGMADKSNCSEPEETMKRLINERKSIKTCQATCLNKSMAPVKMLSKYDVFYDGMNFRLDHSRIEFPKDKSEEGSVSRVVRSENGTLWNHSEYGAEMDYRVSASRHIVDLRLIAIHLQPFGNLDPKRFTVENSIAQRVALKIDRVSVEEINGVFCDVVTSLDSERQGVERSVFFEITSGEYKGCRLKSEPNSFIGITWVEKSKRFNGINFPVRVTTKETNGDIVKFQEEIEIVEIKVNEPIPNDTFSFSGLGVTTGQKVEVRRDASEPQEKLASMYWDGRELVTQSNVNESDLQRFGVWRYLLGGFIVLVSIISIVRIWRRR